MNNQQFQLITSTIQDLSLVRNMKNLTHVVRRAGRLLTDADGICFVVKDKDSSYYADEDAIGPLWKGQSFPLGDCVSGWSILNRTPAIIKDIYADSRIPHEAYKGTFVKSLAMFPIRRIDPVGSLGFYWKDYHQPSEEDMQLMQALADITALSFENLQIYNYLKKDGVMFESADLLYPPQNLVDEIKNLTY